MLALIRKFVRETPFQPFSIRTNSGDVYHVGHPENAAIVGHFVVVALEDGEPAIMLSPLHIVGAQAADIALV